MYIDPAQATWCTSDTKTQQVHIVLGNKHSLFLESFETYKYTLRTK
jgi:hypothetical protein